MSTGGVRSKPGAKSRRAWKSPKTRRSTPRPRGMRVTSWPRRARAPCQRSGTAQRRRPRALLVAEGLQVGARLHDPRRGEGDVPDPGAVVVHLDIAGEVRVDVHGRGVAPVLR